MSKVLRSKTPESSIKYAKKSQHYYDNVLRLDSLTIGTKHPDFSTHLNNIAELYRIMGWYDDSENYYLESLRIQDSIYGENHLNLGVTYNNLGLLYDSKKDYDKAISYFTKSIEIKENNYNMTAYCKEK